MMKTPSHGFPQMKEKSQVDESTQKIHLAFSPQLDAPCTTMSNKKPAAIAMRPTKDDWRIMAKLREKFGVDNSQIIRLAIRCLADVENLRAS